MLHCSLNVTHQEKLITIKGKKMKIYSLKTLLALLVSALLLTGCESMDTVDEDVNMDAPEQVETSADEGADTETYSAPEEPEISAEELAAQNAREAAMKEQAALREVRTFYFDFDQALVKTEARAPLSAHAAFLSANPAARIVLEGHCDERGTKEYNMALGESRANAVSRFLVVNGVSKSQIEVISYGELRPANAGHNESAWAQNRRVYIEYK